MKTGIRYDNKKSVRLKIFILTLLLALLALGSAFAESEDAAELIAKAKAAGMHLPQPKGNERLYLGVSDVPGTDKTRLFIAFITTPNGMSLRHAMLYGEALEVPQKGRAPRLVNHESFSRPELWILRDAVSPTSLIFDKESGKGFYDLRLDEKEASCRVVIAGRCEKPKNDVDGEFKAEMNMTLLNISGVIPNEAIDPPTRKEAEEAGMKLPTLQKGETLYLGKANVSQAKALYIAFIRTADGEELKDMKILAKDISINYRIGMASIRQTSTSYYTDVNKALKIGETIEFGPSFLNEFSITDDGAEGVLHYFYPTTKGDVSYPFDLARMRFTKAD